MLTWGPVAGRGKARVEWQQQASRQACCVPFRHSNSDHNTAASHRRHVHQVAPGDLLAERAHDVDVFGDQPLRAAEVAVLHDKASHVLQGRHLGAGSRVVESSI